MVQEMMINKINIRKLYLTITIMLISFMVMAVLPVASADLTRTAPLPQVSFSEDEELSQVLNLHHHYSSDKGQISFSTPSNEQKIQLKVSENGDVVIDSPDNWFGSERVTFLISDGDEMLYESITVTVIPVNDPPVLISPLPDIITFEEDNKLHNAIDLDNHFQDVDGDLLYSSSSENVIVTISENGYVDIAAGEDWHGTEKVTFFASDGEIEISSELLVCVYPVNDAPEPLVPGESITLNNVVTKRVIDLGSYFADCDDDILVYEVSGHSRIECILEPDQNQLVLNAPPDWNGEELITVKAIDSYGKDSSVQLVVISTTGYDSKGQMFYLMGIVFGLAISAVRFKAVPSRLSRRSPVVLSSYRHYKGD
jgi:hypothetical protein